MFKKPNLTWLRSREAAGDGPLTSIESEPSAASLSASPRRRTTGWEMAAEA